MKSCLITGASRGIGAALAKRLACAGRTLWINHRDSADAADALCAELRLLGAHATAVQADITDLAAVRRAAERVSEGGGRLDVLVHNAAAPLVPKPVLKLDWERDVEPQMQTACKGFLHCIQALTPVFAEEARVVVVLTDALVHRPPAQMGAYLAAKGALWALARAAAKDLQRRRVSFAFVSPGMTQTELLDAYGERALELFAAEHPLGRLATPGDIADVLAGLVDGPAYLNGANVIVNGGTEY